MHPKQYLDRQAECRRIGVSPATLDRRCKEDGYPFIRFGRLKLFDPELSDAWLAGRIHNGRAAELAKHAA